MALLDVLFAAVALHGNTDLYAMEVDADVASDASMQPRSSCSSPPLGRTIPRPGSVFFTGTMT
jgi:hypothetical protein